MLNTIVTIAAITVLMTVCIVMYIRNKRRTEALWRTIDECKKETKAAQEAVIQTKENCEQVVKEYNALNQSGLHIIKHKKQKEIYNTTYEAIRKFIHTDSIGIGILNGL
jgi:hypothetical protein